MASSGERSRDEEHDKKAGTPASSTREEAGKSGVKQTVESAARLYYEFCRKAARTINRLKRDD